MNGMSKISQNLTKISSNFTPNCQGFAKCYSCLKCITDISLSHYVLPGIAIR